MCKINFYVMVLLKKNHNRAFLWVQGGNCVEERDVSFFQGDLRRNFYCITDCGVYVIRKIINETILVKCVI
jgi:hypothetical protein